MEVPILRTSACIVAQSTCDTHDLMPTKKSALREEGVVALDASRNAVGETSVGSVI